MKNLMSIFLVFFTLSAFGQASTITYTDKTNAVPTASVPGKFVADDANMIKTVVNQHAGEINGKQAALVSGTNIKTVNGTSLLGAGNIDLISSMISTTITNGVTTSAPNENIVFDELALRVLLSSFVDGETPSGTINSINVTFTIANTPVAGSVHLYRNGLRLKGGGVDYSISGPTITFIIPPDPGDNLLTDYRK